MSNIEATTNKIAFARVKQLIVEGNFGSGVAWTCPTGAEPLGEPPPLGGPPPSPGGGSPWGGEFGGFDFKNQNSYPNRVYTPSLSLIALKM